MGSGCFFQFIDKNKMKRGITDEESDWKKPLFLEKTNSDSLSKIFQFNELDLANDILNDE